MAKHLSVLIAVTAKRSARPLWHFVQTYLYHRDELFSLYFEYMLQPFFQNGDYISWFFQLFKYSRTVDAIKLQHVLDEREDHSSRFFGKDIFCGQLSSKTRETAWPSLTDWLDFALKMTVRANTYCNTDVQLFSSITDLVNHHVTLTKIHFLLNTFFVVKCPTWQNRQ